jgi:hypothetical protein
MQVSDPAGPGSAGATSKDEVRPVGDELPADPARARSGARFRNALERKHRAPGDGAGDGAAGAAAMAGWFRAEPSAANSRPAAIAPVNGPGTVDRILLGSGPDGPQARIRIGAGALAGTEIQLSGGGAGHAVEARLLTHAASSRQTLSVVMDEIRARLRDKGIVLSTRAAGSRPMAETSIDGAVDEPSAAQPPGWTSGAPR